MLQIVTPASSKKLTTAQAIKDELNKPTLDDAWLDTLITEQSARIDDFCKRTFAKQTYRQTERMSRRYDDLVLMGWPVASVSLLTENDRTLLTSEYEVDYETGYIIRLYADRQITWPVGKFVIEFEAGYTLPGTEGYTLPRPVERACKELVKGAVFAKMRDPALKTLILPGVIEETYFIGNPGNATLPPEVEGMLAPYKASVT